MYSIKCEIGLEEFRTANLIENKHILNGIHRDERAIKKIIQIDS